MILLVTTSSYYDGVEKWKQLMNWTSNWTLHFKRLKGLSSSCVKNSVFSGVRVAVNTVDKFNNKLNSDRCINKTRIYLVRKF